MCDGGEVLEWVRGQKNKEMTKEYAGMALQTPAVYAATHVNFSRPLGINYQSLTGVSYSYLASLRVAMYNGTKTMNYNNGGIGNTQLNNIPMKQEIIIPQLETRREQLFTEIGRMRANPTYIEAPLGYNN